MNKKQQLELYQQILSIYDGGEWANKEGLAEAIKDMLLGPDYGDTFWDDEMAQQIFTDCLYIFEGKEASSQEEVDDAWRYLKSRLKEIRTFVTKKKIGRAHV